MVGLQAESAYRFDSYPRTNKIRFIKPIFVDDRYSNHNILYMAKLFLFIIIISLALSVIFIFIFPHQIQKCDLCISWRGCVKYDKVRYKV